MNVTIIEKNEQPLLSRTEIAAEVSFDAATPSRDSIKEKIASLIHSDAGLVVVRHIYSLFGSKKAKILAYHYSSKEDLERIEAKQKAKKKEGAAPEQKEAAK